MKIAARMRWPAWIALLAVAAAVSLWFPDAEPDQLVQAVEPRSRAHTLAAPDRASRGEAAERVRLERLNERLNERAVASQQVADVFAARSWKKPELPAEAQRPSAPPLPFTYLGRLHSAGSDTAFVAMGDRNLVLRAGDMIQDTYRVERIAGSAVTFRHLPSGAQQTLVNGGSP